MESVALVDRLRGRVRLVQAVLGDGNLAPRITCQRT